MYASANFYTPPPTNQFHAAGINQLITNVNHFDTRTYRSITTAGPVTITTAAATGVLDSYTLTNNNIDELILLSFQISFNTTVANDVRIDVLRNSVDLDIGYVVRPASGVLLNVFLPILIPRLNATTPATNSYEIRASINPFGSAVTATITNIRVTHLQI